MLGHINIVSRSLIRRIVFVMLPCKEQQAAAYKGNRKIAFCPDRQKCPRQICTDLTALVCATAHQNQVWEGHSASCRDQCHEVELCGSVFFRGQNGDLHGMVLLLTMVEDGFYIVKSVQHDADSGKMTMQVEKADTTQKKTESKKKTSSIRLSR